MTTTEIPTIVGAGVDRVDGPSKVTGAAAYPSDVDYPDLAHAALVRSTVAAGRISRIDAGAAKAAPRVLAVITHENAPKLERGSASLLGPAPPPPLQDDRILHHGQYIAVVVAETPQEAAAAARLVEVTYDAADAVLDIEDSRGELQANPWGADVQRGGLDAGLASAEIAHRATYTTAENTNNPLGLFATTAAWDGDTVTLHDATQWTVNVQAFVAATFGIPPAAVRVHAQYLGGAFGAGSSSGRTWSSQRSPHACSDDRSRSSSLAPRCSAASGTGPTRFRRLSSAPGAMASSSPSSTSRP
jgi:CO/xanthine dehydrogenase Mo-binding subunit